MNKTTFLSCDLTKIKLKELSNRQFSGVFMFQSLLPFYNVTKRSQNQKIIWRHFADDGVIAWFSSCNSLCFNNINNLWKYQIKSISGSKVIKISFFSNFRLYQIRHYAKSIHWKTTKLGKTVKNKILWKVKKILLQKI